MASTHSNQQESFTKFAECSETGDALKEQVMVNETSCWLWFMIIIISWACFQKGVCVGSLTSVLRINIKFWYNITYFIV